MSAKKFDLFVGCFPCGDVYCNKAVLEYEDYKKIAFIDYKGTLQLYVDPSYIPGDVLLRIEHDADTKKANFREKWEKLPEMQKYIKLLDSSGIGGSIYAAKFLKDLELHEKIDFYEFIVYGWLPHSEKVASEIEKYKNSEYYCRGLK